MLNCLAGLKGFEVNVEFIATKDNYSDFLVALLFIMVVVVEEFGISSGRPCMEVRSYPVRKSFFWLGNFGLLWTL